MKNAITIELTAVSSDDLARATGGKASLDANGNLVFDAAGADAYKRALDREYAARGFDVNPVSRSVARRVGKTDTFTVETPRLNSKGDRRTAGVQTGFGHPGF